MKKLLFLFLLAGLFTACTEKELETNNSGSVEGNLSQYLSVTIVSSSNFGTRAEYEDGNPKENAVTSVRFFFFDENNAAAIVKKTEDGQSQSFYDWEPDDDDIESGEKPNVEKILSATIVINGKEGGKKPASIVAVINPNDKVKNLGNPSLSNLNECIEEFMPVEDNENNYTDFVMSNSVYAQDGKKMEAVKIEHVWETPEKAKANPVIIYVERVNAKLTLSVSSNLETIGSNVYATGENNGIDNPIYVEFLGWNVTDVATTSRLMKEINPQWAEDLFSIAEPWNSDNYHRSFWAINPNGLKYTVGNFREAKKYTKFEGQIYTYLQENAASDGSGSGPGRHPTKVIVAAQLVDKNGKSYELAEWSGVYYAGEEAVLTAIANSLSFYKEGEQGRTKITPNDLELVQIYRVNPGDGTVDETKKPQSEQSGQYAVVAVIKSTVSEDTKWYASKDQTDQKFYTNNKVNQYILNNLPNVKYWKDGYTYYYFDVKHLADENFGTGYTGKGIVRNHIYKCNIQSLTGLGTPVYDPDDVIYPEKPEDEFYIAAKIDILSWRIVSHDYDLKW